MKAAAEAIHPAPAVLVVDDEPEMRFLLKENLEFEGYAVTATESGEEALGEIARRSFAVMIVDVMLPRMSGFELCREVRARGQHLPIIILTARSAESDRVVGLDLGADDYVTKPFNIDELVARLLAVLKRSPSFYQPMSFAANAHR
ncbi:MAG: response regulator [Acidobacteria bacterium]|nr:response regulator [Acidobacteriota bacterium]